MKDFDVYVEAEGWNDPETPAIVIGGTMSRIDVDTSDPDTFTFELMLTPEETRTLALDLLATLASTERSTE